MSTIVKTEKIGRGFVVTCECDECGTEIRRPQGDFQRYNNHFCGISCRRKAGDKAKRHVEQGNTCKQIARVKWRRHTNEQLGIEVRI